MISLCSEGLQSRIKTNREAELKAKEQELKRKASEMDRLLAADAVAGGSNNRVGESVPMEVDPGPEEDEDLKAALALSVQPPATVLTAITSSSSSTAASSAFGNALIPNDFTGIYELFGIVTHKGRSADSGHYIAWIRSSKDPEVWLKFDDAEVSEVTYTEIVALKGSGDWHTAYLNFYRAKTSE